MSASPMPATLRAGAAFRIFKERTGAEVSRATFYRWLHAGLLDGFGSDAMEGGMILIRREELDRLIGQFSPPPEGWKEARQLLTVNEVAELLKVKRYMIIKLVRQGRLHAVRLSRFTTRITRESVDVLYGAR